MSDFWPSGLDLSDTRSPRDILNVAQDDWDSGSGGIMKLILQDTTSKSGYSMIVVHAKHVPSDRTSTLFTVIHRPDNPYPLDIQLAEDNLPDFLKKSYSRSGFAVMAAAIGSMNDSVENTWVSDTPSEFQKKLVQAFNSGVIKSKILNLASNVSSVLDDTIGDPQEDSLEN
ncbi:MAG: hypothetical protein H6658_03765 [Ardenticatenaceae bacterium]|nr:hypothetical protein [Ardenticatenaceae bacterium]